MTHFTIPGPMTVKRTCLANRPDIIVVSVCPAQHHHNSGTCTPVLVPIVGAECVLTESRPKCRCPDTRRTNIPTHGASKSVTEWWAFRRALASLMRTTCERSTRRSAAGTARTVRTPNTLVIRCCPWSDEPDEHHEPIALGLGPFE